LTDSMEWVAVALEEYKTLRTESLAAIEQMQRTLQIGVVAIGVITGIGVDTSESAAVVQAGIAVATPAFAALVLILWLDELRRSVFAGAHVARIEHAIAQRYEGEAAPLTWETKIQKEYDPASGYRYHRHWATAGVLFAAAAPMVFTGLVRLGQDGEWALFTATAVVVAVLLTVAVGYQVRIHREVADKHRDARVEDRLGGRGERGTGLGRRGQLDQVAIRVADVRHVLSPRLCLGRADRGGALLDRAIEGRLDVVGHEADLERRPAAGPLLRPVDPRQVRGGELVRGEGEHRLAGVQLRVLPALVQETAALTERALVELQAGCDVGNVEDRVAEPHRPSP